MMAMLRIARFVFDMVVYLLKNCWVCTGVYGSMLDLYFAG
jgi:hypothetical protein